MLDEKKELLAQISRSSIKLGLGNRNKESQSSIGIKSIDDFEKAQNNKVIEKLKKKIFTHEFKKE